MQTLHSACGLWQSAPCEPLPSRNVHVASLHLSTQRCIHNNGRRARSGLLVRAALGSSLVDTVVVGAALAGLGLSALPLLTGEARERNENRPPDAEEAEEAGFTWGVASAIGFLPYVNWTAWVFRGMTEERDAAICYAFAALYGLPWVFHDLRLDGFTGTLLLLGAIHLQVERMAATEAVQMRIPGVSELASQLSKTVAKPAADVAQTVRRKQLAAGERRPLLGQEEEGEQLPDEAELDQRELERWDEVFKQRAKQERRDK